MNAGFVFSTCSLRTNFPSGPELRTDSTPSWDISPATLRLKPISDLLAESFRRREGSRTAPAPELTKRGGIVAVLEGAESASRSVRTGEELTSMMCEGRSAWLSGKFRWRRCRLCDQDVQPAESVPPIENPSRFLSAASGCLPPMKNRFGRLPCCLVWRFLPAEPVIGSVDDQLWALWSAAIS